MLSFLHSLYKLMVQILKIIKTGFVVGMSFILQRINGMIMDYIIFTTSGQCREASVIRMQTSFNKNTVASSLLSPVLWCVKQRPYKMSCDERALKTWYCTLVSVRRPSWVGLASSEISPHYKATVYFQILLPTTAGKQVLTWLIALINLWKLSGYI